jgi:ribose transport system substrate-binding protein
MSGQRQFLAVAAAAALLAAVWYSNQVKRAEAPAPVAPVKIALVTGGSGPYWQLAVHGAQAAAKELNVELTVETPPNAESLAEQTEILERIAVSGVQVVAVSPVDAEGQTALIDQMAKQDIFVVTFDSDAPDSKRRGYVGTSNFAAGRNVARLVDEALPEGGKIAVLVANRTKDNLLDRMGGMSQVLGQLNDGVKAKSGDKTLEIIDFFVDDGDDKKCGELVRQILADHADVACLVGLNARHGPVLMDVLKAEGQLGKIKVIAFDEAPETLAGVESGDIFATVAQDPYDFGAESVRMLAALCRGDEFSLPIGATNRSVESVMVRKENLDAYRAKLKARQKADAGASDDEA